MSGMDGAQRDIFKKILEKFENGEYIICRDFTIIL